MKSKEISKNYYVSLISKIDKVQKDVSFLKEQFSHLQQLLLHQLKREVVLNQCYAINNEAMMEECGETNDTFSANESSQVIMNAYKVKNISHVYDNENSISSRTRNSLNNANKNATSCDELFFQDGIKVELDSGDDYKSNLFKNNCEKNDKNSADDSSTVDDNDDYKDEDYEASDTTQDDIEWDPTCKKSKKLTLKMKKKNNSDEAISEKKYKSPRKTKYQCGECKLFYYLRSVPKTDPYKCKKCIQKTLIDKEALFEVNINLLGRKVIKCGVCDKYMQSNHMKRHAREHLDIRTHECDVCKKTFKRLYHLKRHQFTHTVKDEITCDVIFEGGRPYKCRNCDDSFKERKQLNHHLDIKHGIKVVPKETSLKCQEGGEDAKGDDEDDGMDDTELSHDEQLIDQVKQKDDGAEIEKDRQVDDNNKESVDGVDKVKSETIKDGSDAKKKKKKRDESFSTNRERSHMCDVCGQTFFRSSHLRRHAVTHGTKSFRCEMCGKLFSRKSHMNKHLNNHRTKGTEGFNCYVCGEKFESNATMLDHISEMHKELEAQTITCTFCDVEFKSASQLNAHLKTQHFTQLHASKNEDDSEDCDDKEHKEHKNFSCSVCSRSYKNLKSLLLHTNSHSNNNRPHECDVCEAKFSTMHTMKRHRGLHFERYKYKCNFCCVTYTRKYMLKNHLIKNHNKEGHVTTKMEESIDSNNHTDSSGANESKTLNLSNEKKNNNYKDDASSDISDDSSIDEYNSLNMKTNENSKLMDLKVDANVKEESLNPLIPSDDATKQSNCFKINEMPINHSTNQKDSSHSNSIELSSRPQSTNQISQSNKMSNHATSFVQSTNQISSYNQTVDHSMVQSHSHLNPSIQTNNYMHSFNPSSNYMMSMNKPINCNDAPFQSSNHSSQSSNHIKSLIQSTNQNNVLLPTANDVNMLNLSTNQHPLPVHHLYTQLKF